MHGEILVGAGSELFATVQPAVLNSRKKRAYLIIEVDQGMAVSTSLNMFRRVERHKIKRPLHVFNAWPGRPASSLQARVPHRHEMETLCLKMLEVSIVSSALS